MNPGDASAPYSLSRGAPSATWVLLQMYGEKLAEREGFEPPVPFGITGFQDQRLQPLGHLSKAQPAIVILSKIFCFVKAKMKILLCIAENVENLKTEKAEEPLSDRKRLI